MFNSEFNQYRLPFLALALALTVVLLPSFASAQTVTGTLQGTLTDSKGAVVPGVDVSVVNVDTGQEQNLKTNQDGSYSAPFLPLGRYKVTASG